MSSRRLLLVQACALLLLGVGLVALLSYHTRTASDHVRTPATPSKVLDRTVEGGSSLAAPSAISDRPRSDDAAASPAPTSIDDRVGQLDAFLASGNDDDDRLVSILSDLTTLVLSGGHDTAAHLETLITQPNMKPGVLSYLLVLLALTRDPSAIPMLERLAVAADDLVGCYAIESLLLFSSSTLRTPNAPTKTLRDFWLGMLLDEGVGRRLRPGLMDRLIARRQAPRKVVSEDREPIGDTWTSALGARPESNVRDALLRISGSGASEAVRCLTLTSLDRGTDLDAVAKSIVESDASKRLRGIAVEALSVSDENRRFLLSQAQIERDPRVLASLVVCLTESTVAANQVETARILERIAVERGDDRTLANRVTSSLSALDGAESVQTLSRILQEAPSVVVRLEGVASMRRYPYGSAYVLERARGISLALWDPDPSVCNAAASALLQFTADEASREAMAKLADEGLAERVNHATSWSGSPDLRKALGEAIEATKSHK